MLKALLNLVAPMDTAGDLFPGVEKPTTTLCKMIAASLLADLPDYKIREYETYSRSYAFDTDKFSLQIFHHDRAIVGRYDDVQMAKEHWKASVLTPAVSLDEREQDILIKAFHKLKALKEQQKADKQESDNQRRAVDALASWMGIEEKKPGSEAKENPDEHQEPRRVCVSSAEAATDLSSISPA